MTSEVEHILEQDRLRTVAQELPANELTVTQEEEQELERITKQRRPRSPMAPFKSTELLAEIEEMEEELEWRAEKQRPRTEARMESVDEPAVIEEKREKDEKAG
jgi:hypothetical protein